MCVSAEPITALAFDSSNRYLVTSGDKHLQVIHNVPGYHATITDLQQREKKASSSGMRDRIRQQIEEARCAPVGTGSVRFFLSFFLQGSLITFGNVCVLHPF